MVAELDPECLSGSDAVSLYTCLAGMERLVLAGKALLAPRIEASGVWKDTGHPNAAALLASLEGVSPGQARATLDIGRRLVELPGTEDALRRGALSAPKATELCGAGALDPDRESELLAGAEDEPLAAVKERCHRSRATSSARDPRATWRRIRADRHFAWWTDAEGAFCFRGRDTADRGAFVLGHLDPLARSLRKAARARGDDPRESDRAYRADAFYALITRRDPARPVPPPGRRWSGPPRLGRPSVGTPGPMLRYRYRFRRRSRPATPSSPTPPDRPIGFIRTTRSSRPTSRSSGFTESPGSSRVRAPGLFDPEPDPDLDPESELDPDPDSDPTSDPTSRPICPPIRWPRGTRLHPRPTPWPSSIVPRPVRSWSGWTSTPCSGARPRRVSGVSSTA